MKILMIAPVPFFAPRGTPIAIFGRLRALSSLGHDVDLIIYHVGKDIVIPGVNIYRIQNLPFIKEVPVGPSWTKVLLDVLVVTKAFRMLLSDRYDLLHTHEEASVFGSVLAKIFKIRHMYDFHSSIPEALGNFGYGRFSLLIKLFEWIERRVIQGSDAIIAISPALADYIRKIDKIVPIEVIENSIEEVDISSIKDESLKTFKCEYSLLDREKIVLYVGTFEPYQGLELIIDSVELVIKRFKEVKFVFVGGRSDQIQCYRDIADERGVSSYFLFTGIRPPEEIPMFFNIAQVLVSPRISGLNPPLKIYGYLQSGKPIVATNNICHTQVLSPEIAYLVEPNPGDIAEGIVYALENPKLGEKMGERARQFFEEKYNYSNFVKLTDKILRLATK